jgi:hypothetical protein
MQHRVLKDTLLGARRAFSCTSKTGRSHWRLAASAAVLGTLGGAGCSLLYDLSSEQCNASTDCAHFGAGYSCNAVHVCEAPPDVIGGSSGSGGDGGGAGSNPSGGSAGENPAGSSGSNTGGSAGSEPGPECTTNDQCITDHADQPFVCREGTCLDLRTNECPFVIGLDNLRSESPIIIGAYTFIGEESVTDSAVTANYQLALDEFTTNAPGGGLQSGRRKIAMVACDGINSSTFAASLDHLVDVVQVPAVIAPLLAPDLVSVFASKGHDSNIFFLSPIDADSSVTRLDDDGLIWNILGSYAQLAPSYVPLLERAETYLRGQAAQSLQPTDPIRVALIDDETTAQKDISAELIGTSTPLFFNGKSAIDPTNTDPANPTCGPSSDEPCPNFLARTIPSSGVPGDYTDTIDALNAFQPHVIVSVTGPAFVTNVLEALEVVWPASNPVKPFYLLGPYHASLPEMADAVTSGNSTQCNGVGCPLRSRVLGINFESARDAAVLNSYRTRFATSYSQYPINFENFYDAAWYMLYAIAGAGDVALTGDAIARGMGRLVKPDPSPEYAVGPSAVSDVLFALANLPSSSGIQLDGTMGPPDFDPASGARKTLGSGYCIALNGVFMYDVLRYESTGTPTMSGPPPSPPTCVPPGF